MPQPLQITLSPAFHCGCDDCSTVPAKIDAGDHWKTPHHRRLAGDGEAVLVVQRRPLDPDRNVTFHQFGFVELRERDGGALFRLVDPDRLECCQRLIS